jgi:hypothetical protein
MCFRIWWRRVNVFVCLVLTSHPIAGWGHAFSDCSTPICQRMLLDHRCNNANSTTNLHLAGNARFLHAALSDLQYSVASNLVQSVLIRSGRKQSSNTQFFRLGIITFTVISNILHPLVLEASPFPFRIKVWSLQFRLCYLGELDLLIPDPIP